MFDAQLHADSFQHLDDQFARDDASDQRAADGHRRLVGKKPSLRREPFDLLQRQPEALIDLFDHSQQHRDVDRNIDSRHRNHRRAGRDQRAARDELPAFAAICMMSRRVRESDWTLRSASRSSLDAHACRMKWMP